ncbi:MAG: TetR/AcrR family transcriptional regulator [Pseudomonadota bacterium]
MARVPQKRRVKTRAKLVAAAGTIVAREGYAALRVEDVVRDAGVAKGTFFSHFEDKDSLLAQLIGEEMHVLLAEAADSPMPHTIDALCSTLEPLYEYMAQDRFVFDIIMRYSGAAGIEDETEIAINFFRQVALLTRWLDNMADVRRDVGTVLLAEGVHAFAINAMSLKFCALHNANSIRDRLRPYIHAWLAPGSSQRDHQTDADQQ